MGTVLMLDAPAGLEFGIDFQEWSIGERFAGVKMVPVGPHYCFTRRPNAPGQPSQGFWVYVPNNGEGMCCVMRWDGGGEEFVALEGIEADRLAAAVAGMEFDSRLGPYSQPPRAPGRCWADCVGHVDAAHLAWLRHAGRRKELPPRTRALDRSPEVEALLRTRVNLLGWIESSFIEFSLVHNLEAFETWRDLVVLMCNCVTALRVHQAMFAQFAAILTWQVDESGPDLLWSDHMQANIILHSISQFVEDIQTSAGELTHAKLVANATALALAVPQMHLDDDAPTIVED